MIYFLRSYNYFVVFALALATNVFSFQTTAADEPLDRGLIVDLNPDNGRSDVRTADVFNWSIPTGKSETTQSFGKISITIRAKQADGQASTLAWGWWKAGYDFAATLSSDGATTVKPGQQIEILVDGLAPGKHRLVTWHNAWDSTVSQGDLSLTLKIGSQVIQQSCKRSAQVLHDDLALSCSFDFQVENNETATLRIATDDQDSFAILNALAIDIPDPRRVVRRPNPIDRDEHVEPKPLLQWEPPWIAGNQPMIQDQAADKRSESPPSSPNTNVAHYHLFLGQTLKATHDADHNSAEYLGKTRSTSWQTEITDFMHDSYWRVDCELADGTQVKGRVFRMRVRRDAFPGAEGYGRFAIGGRGGRVIVVTNLSDSGPGSLREAVEAEGPRTVVFETGGTIQLKSKLLIRNPYITIAGQTAPGDGICVRGYTLDASERMM